MRAAGATAFIIAIRNGTIAINAVTAKIASAAANLNEKPSAFSVKDASRDLRLMGAADITFIRSMSDRSTDSRGRRSLNVHTS